VEQAGGVDQVEGSRTEGRIEDVPRDDANRRGELRVPQRFSSFANALGVCFQGGESASLADTLAQALDPERRGASSVEDFEAADVAEEVELAIAEGDQVFCELLALGRRQRIIAAG
jgi:hypothetical protein